MDVVRPVTIDDWVDWLHEMGFVPDSHLTLTWRDSGPTTSTSALWWWGKLVAALNVAMFNRQYTHVVGHSYFSYVVGVEWQQRGAIHLHVVVDAPVSYATVHEWWGTRCGFAWIRGEVDYSQVRYVLKYALKGGNLDIEHQAYFRGLADGHGLVGLNEKQRAYVLMTCKRLAGRAARLKARRPADRGNDGQAEAK